MNGNPRAWYESLARLLDYPTAAFAGHVDESLALAQEAGPEVREPCAAFAGATESLSLAALEELYIQTFDFSPKCTLDIGWQLFAEDYNRGLFLAKLRAESRRLGVSETRELPDHLPHVLRLLARMEAAAAADFAATCVVPAVEKAVGALDETNPYRHLLHCVLVLLGELASERNELAWT